MINSDNDLSNGKDQLNNEDKEVNDGSEYSNSERRKGINRTAECLTTMITTVLKSVAVKIGA